MRKLVLILISCTALLLTGYAGYRGYKVWKQSHMLGLAKRFAAKSDARNALLCINQVLRSNPRNVDACRMLAEFADSARSPSAVLWWSKVVQLNPNSVDDRLALARTALVMRDLISATNALEGVSESGKQSASFQNTAGLVDVALNQLPDAEAHFLEAMRLEPTNAAPKLNLAVIRLRGTNTAAATGARQTLRELASDPVFNCQALRELVADAVRQRQTNEALHLALELTQKTNSAFGDKLVRLELLRSTQNPEFQASLLRLQQEAVSEPGKTYELAAWQTMTTGPGSALAWIETLPAGVRTNQAIAFMSAQCRTILQDWRGLLVAAETQNWAELEFVRHAFMARAMRGLELASSAKTEWEQALKGGAGRRENLVMLLRLTTEWNWPNEQEQILTTVISQFPSEKWASAALAQFLFNRGRTQALMALFDRLARANPSDFPAKNNLALIALLLQANELKPHELARQVYERAPTNASYASTYAYSLYVQEKRAEALKVMEQLSPQQLEVPSIAGYYGVILQASGDGPKAKKYLELASKAALLPEERRLVQQAQN